MLIDRVISPSTFKSFSHSLVPQNVRERLPPRGKLAAKQTERAGMESRRPTAAFPFTRPLTAVAVFPEGEPAGLPIVSLIPRAFRQLVPHVSQNVHEKASPRGSWPEGPERAGMKSRRPLAANSLYSPSHPFGELSRGRACLLMDRVICPKFLSSVSPTCASKRTRAGFPLGEAGPKGLKGQAMGNGGEIPTCDFKFFH